MSLTCSVLQIFGTNQVSAEDDLDEPMAKVIASFRYCRANFHKHEEPETFLFESLCASLSCNQVSKVQMNPSEH